MPRRCESYGLTVTQSRTSPERQDDRYRIRFYQDHGTGPLWFDPDCEPGDLPAPSPPLAERLDAWCRDRWQAELDQTDFREAVRDRLDRRARTLASQVETEFGSPWHVHLD